MARKKPHEEHENHERWLVSYADFITLLFAFFVVMYSISSVNEGKYRVLSDSLVSAFRSSQKSLMPIQIGSNVKSPASMSTPPQFMQSPQVISSISTAQMASGGLVDDDTGHATKGTGNLDRLSRKVSSVMAKLIDEGLVVIHRKKNWVEVIIKDSFLFSAGTATLLRPASDMLDKVAGALVDVTNQMRIEGYTDDQLVRNQLYPSNWELSLARAVTVIKRFEKNSISSWRMSATGFGQFRPAASNSTAEGRAKNRRVAIIIMASQASEGDYETQQAAEREQSLMDHQVALDQPKGGESGVVSGSKVAEETLGVAGGDTEMAPPAEVAQVDSPDPGHSGVGHEASPTEETASLDAAAHASPGVPGTAILPLPIRLPPPIKFPVVVPPQTR